MHANDDLGFYNEASFNRLLQLEEKRTERSRKPFLVMLLDVSILLRTPRRDEVLDQIGETFSSSLRETDVRGWYKEDAVIGVIFTETTSVDEITRGKIFLKVHQTLCKSLDLEEVANIDISFYVFPEKHDSYKANGGFDLSLYSDLTDEGHSGRVALVTKRAMDIVGSLLTVLVLSPVLLAIAVAIKLTSKGPVLFKQERIGMGGNRFTFLKFRSMYTNCDERNHKEYIEKFICEQKSASAPSKKGGAEVYKLNDDPRITPLGRFLRKTSLDELPQFINVLKGEMSLVGPRPPIPYECDLYDIWHRRRLLSVKPGITGLWQVEGRSCTTFDDMVRLDLKYIREWSLWLDIKLILKTPWVVLTCRGAY
jgi:exopolysaccharide biosynthesis polyprenyl glycosylphosphotransferase